MNSHGTMTVPLITPMHPQPSDSPAVATARQLQAHLVASYRIESEIRSHNGVARVELSREFSAWCMAGAIMWAGSRIDPSTGRKRTVRLPAEQTAKAAYHIAARFRQLHCGG